MSICVIYFFLIKVCDIMYIFVTGLVSEINTFSMNLHFIFSELYERMHV